MKDSTVLPTRPHLESGDSSVSECFSSATSSLVSYSDGSQINTGTPRRSSSFRASRSAWSPLSSALGCRSDRSSAHEGPMTERSWDAMTSTPSFARSIRNQKRALITAGCLVIACVWISVPLGEWRSGMFLAIGIVLGAINHLLTEHFLLRSVESGELPTRKQYASASLFRLLGVSGVAVVLAARLLAPRCCRTVRSGHLPSHCPGLHGHPTPPRGAQGIERAD